MDVKSVTRFSIAYRAYLAFREAIEEFETTVQLFITNKTGARKERIWRSRICTGVVFAVCAAAHIEEMAIRSLRRCSLNHASERDEQFDRANAGERNCNRPFAFTCFLDVPWGSPVALRGVR